MSRGTIESALSQLFASRGWTVPAETPTTLAKADFFFSAENDVAVVVAIFSDGARMRETANSASTAIAALSQPYQGPKAWEVYVLLVVRDLSEVDEDTIISVQRDLLYSRKLILDADKLGSGTEANAYLERKLSLLFPLSQVESNAGPAPRDLLEESLIEKGHPTRIIRALMAGVDEAEFEPIEFLLSELSESA